MPAGMYYIAINPQWLRAPRYRRLKRLGVEAPLETLIAAWEWALSEYGGPDVEVDDLEDAVNWQGEPGALVSALLATGHLEGSTFVRWWDDGPGRLLESRARSRKRKADSRARKKAAEDAAKAEGPAPVTVTPPGRPPESAGRPAPVTVTSPPSHGKERRGQERKGEDSKSFPRAPALVLNSDPELGIEWTPVRTAALEGFLAAYQACERQEVGPERMRSRQQIYDAYATRLDTLSALRGASALDKGAVALRKGRMEGGYRASIEYVDVCDNGGGGSSGGFRRQARGM